MMQISHLLFLRQIRWLVSEEDLESEETVTESVPEKRKESACDNSADTYGLSSCEINFIKAVLNSDVGEIQRIATAIGAVSDTVAERVNEAFSDGFGDVIIEGIAPDLSIIEDYKEDVEKWLSKITK